MVVLMNSRVVSTASARTVSLALSPYQYLSNGTLVFSASLSGLGLSKVGSVNIVDDDSEFGGSAGIFSGFDLDAVFLDADGDLDTSRDRSAASSFQFSAGSTRATPNTSMQPNSAHPGPTFGSTDATTIDLSTATLNAFDAVANASVNGADGFLTLGDGGSLIANFTPEISVDGNLFLFTGEVGGQTGEGLSATVTASDQQGGGTPPDATDVSEPNGLTLLALGLTLLGLGSGVRLRAQS